MVAVKLNMNTNRIHQNLTVKEGWPCIMMTVNKGFYCTVLCRFKVHVRRFISVVCTLIKIAWTNMRDTQFLVTYHDNIIVRTKTCAVTQLQK